MMGEFHMGELVSSHSPKMSIRWIGNAKLHPMCECMIVLIFVLSAIDW